MNRWFKALSVYKDRRFLTILFLGFSSGLPLLLTFSTLSLWMRQVGVDLTTIGIFALVGIPYAFKFVWSPIIDGTSIPVLGRLLGRRRGWALAIQIALVGAILLVGSSDPLARPFLTALAAFFVAFLAASQDIVIDAYRIEILKDREQGPGAAAIQVGYRLAMLVAGGGAAIIADHYGWVAAYYVMAALVSVGMVTVLLSREPGRGETAEPTPRPKAGGRERFLAWFEAHVVAPFTDFMARSHWPLILVFIVLYKFGDAVAGVMANPFYIDMGFSLTEIGVISKGFGLVMTLSGVALGGLVVARYGILNGLLICGVLQMFSNLMYSLQATVGDSVSMLMATIAIENLSGGMGSTAFVAYISSLCGFGLAATQYALFSSLAAVGRTVLSSAAGWVADNMDWVTFFVISTFAALPGLLILLWLIRKTRAAPEVAGSGP
ncbi:MAG: MFS transporter [Proteobacteria bacterium]|nr:MFS transporter [Pseudomonadota bacterium]